MKAMVIKEFGGPEVFTAAEVPTPEPGPGQVLIRVAASSVNPVDWKIRSGKIPSISPAFPAILHEDAAGVVETVGEGVTSFRPGDEVYGCAGGVLDIPGALAEYMVADADLIAPRPQKLSLQESAALPLVGITAWEALIDRSQVQPGQRVLVHAGTGGVGHVGVQLARNAGAIVFTTVSNDHKAARAKDLGADVVINYRQQSVEDYVEEHTGGEGFDVVFDTVGGDNLANSFQAARTGGVVACIAARSTQDLTILHSRNLTFHAVFMLVPLLTGRGRDHHGEILRRLAQLVDAGRVRPLLDPYTFDFDQVAQAHEKQEGGGAIGKIVLHARL